jgi:hypothetical protein
MGGGCPVPLAGLEGCVLMFRVRGVDFYGTPGAWSEIVEVDLLTLFQHHLKAF